MSSELPIEPSDVLRKMLSDFGAATLRKLEDDMGVSSQARLRELLDAFDSTIEVLSTHYLYFPVKPQAKQSARFGKGGHVIADPKKKAYVGNLRAQVKTQWGKKAATDLPVALTIYYCFDWNRKDKKARKPETLEWDFFMPVPDLDNLAKPLKDALAGVVYCNDSQVVQNKSRKIRWLEPAILVKVEEILPKYL